MGRHGKDDFDFGDAVPFPQEQQTQRVYLEGDGGSDYPTVGEDQREEYDEPQFADLRVEREPFDKRLAGWVATAIMVTISLIVLLGLGYIAFAILKAIWRLFG